MSANPVFIQALADACGRPIEIAPVLEATTLGAAYLAGMAIGTWADEDDVAAAWTPRQVVDPRLTDPSSAPTGGPGGWRPGVGPRAPSPSCPPLTSEAVRAPVGARGAGPSAGPPGRCVDRCIEESPWERLGWVGDHARHVIPTGRASAGEAGERMSTGIEAVGAEPMAPSSGRPRLDPQATIDEAVATARSLHQCPLPGPARHARGR